MSLFKKPADLKVSHNVKVLIYGQPGSGKAQPVFTHVLTPNGYKMLGDIKVGDKVIGSDGKPQTVEGVFPQGVRPIYRVETNDGGSVLCDIEHLWTVRTSGGNSRKAGFRTFTLHDMIDKGIVCPISQAREESGRKPTPRYEIPLMKAVEYQEQAYEVHPYILGVLIGDGSLVGSVTQFSSPDMDSEIANKVESLLPEGYHLYKNEAPACPQYTICRDSSANEGYIQRIQRMALNAKSGEKFIPYEYFLGSKEQRLELLRGLMDTDGSSDERCRISYSTSSLRLAQDVVELVRSLGGIAKIHAYPREDKDITEYHVNVKLNVCPFSFKRKAENWHETTISRYIVAAHEAGEAECVCIKVSNEDELYVTEDYIVTHNTTVGLSSPDPVLLDFDGGVGRVNGAFQCPTLQVENWAQVNDALNEIEKNEFPCKTIVIDTAGKMLDYMAADIIRENGKYGKADGTLTLQGFGVRKAKFINFLRRVSIMGKNIVFVAHEREEKDGEVKVIRPEIGGSSAGDLIKELDLVGYMQSFSYETTKDGKHQIVVDRTVSWSPTQKYYGKNTCNLPPVHSVANIIDEEGHITGENNFLTLVFAMYEANLQNTANVRAKYDKLLESFAKGIDSVKDAESATEVYQKIESYAGHVWDSKLRTEKMLEARAILVGLKFDPINQKYEAA